ncbi:hypothetical protein [Chryseobacterium herbae]|uniref:SH3 domain-containing protein n=1 Tax=Chryseobacterium herbae TaxID=2976476 RepID=A0ABT2ISU9_9FLAO|nr:hypothetical protein [Chryseobacterium sp. pc1-10]MCT2561899.1 hypothetical protein [Chryseobacterium sp. pc1-10]
MEKIALIIGLFYLQMAYAQVAIGKETVDGDGILDFKPNTTNGILLPIVETLPTNAVEGTILMDKNDKVVKMKTDSEWISLSDPGSIDNVTFNTSAETPAQTNVIIGSTTTTAPGVLVLESPDKALILPKVAAPHISVKDPFPGMICYDTVSKTLAVFDGLKWSYWK